MCTQEIALTSVRSVILLCRWWCCCGWPWAAGGGTTAAILAKGTDNGDHLPNTKNFTKKSEEKQPTNQPTKKTTEQSSKLFDEFFEAAAVARRSTSLSVDTQQRMKPGKCSKAFPTCWSSSAPRWWSREKEKPTNLLLWGCRPSVSFFCVLPKWHHQKQQQQH